MCFEFELKGFANQSSRFQIVEIKSCEEHKARDENLSQSVSDLVSVDDQQVYFMSQKYHNNCWADRADS
jgi:hypothetical protein